MKTFKMILIAITFIFSMNVLAGYTQPAPVEVEIDENDGSFIASGHVFCPHSEERCRVDRLRSQKIF